MTFNTKAFWWWWGKAGGLIVILIAFIVWVMFSTDSTKRDPNWEGFNENLHWISKIDTLGFERKVSRRFPNIGWEGAYSLVTRVDDYDECMRVFGCDTCDYKSFTTDEDDARWRPLWFDGWTAVLDSTWHSKVEFRLMEEDLKALRRIIMKERGMLETLSG